MRPPFKGSAAKWEEETGPACSSCFLCRGDRLPSFPFSPQSRSSYSQLASLPSLCIPRLASETPI